MSGPEGTPNGVDRLAEIKSRRAVNLEDGIYVRMSIWERETLVEIGQAARDISAYAVDSADGPYVLVRFREIQPLRSALARLAPPAEDQGDSGAAEGDA